ncbi:MAG: GH13_10 / GH13 / GH13_36 / GH13_9 / GH13_11, partial [uncultured Friedmanniella sp.]
DNLRLRRLGSVAGVRRAADPSGRVGRSGGGEPGPDGARRGGLVAAGGPAAPGRRGGVRLRLPARRLRHRRRRPPLAAAARGRARLVAHLRRHRVRLDRRQVDRPPARGRGHLRDARRDLHPRGHPRRGRREAGPPPRPGRGLRRGDAGQRLQRHPQLGLRRRPLVHRARGLRWPGGLPALRRRLPRARAGRHPGRGLQPHGPEWELPARVRPLPQRRRRQHLGRVAQPRRPRVRRGPPLHHRQRLDVAARLPRRRPPAGRGARPGRHPGHARARGDGRRGGGAQRLRRSPAAADRRVRPQRPAADHRARGRRLRADGPVERRLPPRPLRQPDRGHQRLLRRLRLPRRAGQGLRGRLLPRRHPVELPAPLARPADRHLPHPDLAAGGLLGQPRPDRQPCHWRAADAQGQRRPGRDRRHAHAAQPLHADDLHGGRVGRVHPVAVLHLPPGARARRGRGQGPARGVRGDGLGHLRRPQPAGPGDVHPLQAGLVRARRGGPRPAAGPHHRPAADPPQLPRPHRPAVRPRPRHLRRRRRLAQARAGRRGPGGELQRHPERGRGGGRPAGDPRRRGRREHRGRPGPARPPLRRRRPARAGV